MTNIKYLKKNNLFEAHQHFLKLSEAYIRSFPEEDMNEADDEQGMEDQAQLGGDAQQAQDMGDPSMGMDDSQGQMGGGMKTMTEVIWRSGPADVRCLLKIFLIYLR